MSNRAAVPIGKTGHQDQLFRWAQNSFARLSCMKSIHERHNFIKRFERVKTVALGYRPKYLLVDFLQEHLRSQRLA